MADEEWTIKITPQGAGFCPSYFVEDYPFFGNRDQMSAMVNLDLSNPNVICPGPKATALTNGTQAGAVTTLIKSVMDIVTSDNVSFAIGGARLYKISATTVQDDTADTPFPHLIDKGTVTGEDGEDTVYYKGKLYYFYNHSGSAGDIGQFNMTSTFDDDWGSTAAANPDTLEYAPHQAINGGDDVVYFANGHFIGTIQDVSGTITLVADALDFPSDAQVASITWNYDRIYAGVNRPNIIGANANQAAIYAWNGVDPSWETDPVVINGRIGALYTRLGTVFVWWQETGLSDRYNFGYYTGTSVKTIQTFSGTLPLYYQVTEEDGYLCWASDGEIYKWGAQDPSMPTRAFQYTKTTYGTAGGIGAPFGDLLMASYATTNFILEKPNASFQTDSSWSTVAFDVSSAGAKAQIDLIQVSTENLGKGAKCDITMYYDKAKSHVDLSPIKYDGKDTTLFKILSKSVMIEDFRLDFSHAEGSDAYPVKIRSVLIKGHYVPNL